MADFFTLSISLTKLMKFFIHWKQAKISNLNIYLIKCVLSHGYLDTLYVVMIMRMGGGGGGGG